MSFLFSNAPFKIIFILELCLDNLVHYSIWF